MFDRMLKADPVTAALGLGMVFIMAPTLAAMGLDDRLFDGQNVWIKPFKFELALAVYFLTLAFFAQWLPDRLLQRRWYRVYIRIVAVMVCAEIVWIAGAAGYGVASHYNNSSLVMAMIYPLMGVFAITLTSVSLVHGLWFLRDDQSLLDATMQKAVGVGLILTALLTVVAASLLSSQPGHFIGTPVTGAQVPFMGWSREVGDLRVSHFLATHAMHVLPVAGLLAMMVPSDRLRAGSVYVAAILFVGLVGFTMVRAWNGLPVFPVV